jgi:hypothetical protein
VETSNKDLDRAKDEMGIHLLTSSKCGKTYNHLCGKCRSIKYHGETMLERLAINWEFQML